MNASVTRRVYGLTGGIGSGKSTVARMLSGLGATVLDADAISRHALDVGTSCYEKTVSAFGREILRGDGTIDRKALAAIVFSDGSARAVLNGIIHPYVRRKLEAGIEEAGEDAVVILDVPLLFESGIDSLTREDIAVICRDSVRIARAMSRDGADREAILKRIAAQMPQEELAKRCSHVIDNSEDLQSLQDAVEKLYAILRE